VTTTGEPQARRVRLLADAPIKEDEGDRLGFASIADSLAVLIDDADTATPFVVSISAPWGAGKTSLANMVARRLRDWPVQRGQPAHIVAWFDAWANHLATDLGAAFAADIARAANRQRPLWRRLLEPLPSPLLSPREQARRRVRLLGFSVLTALLLLPLLVQFVRPAQADAKAVAQVFGVAAASWFLVVYAFVVGRTWIWSAFRAVAAFVEAPSRAAATGSMRDVSSQLGRLIAQGPTRRPGRRFVIFVDDLDRCLPASAVQICEVSAHLLCHHGVVTVLVGDLRAVATAAGLKHASIDGGIVDPHSDASHFGRLFLQKIIQFQFELPPAGRNRSQYLVREFVRLPTTQATPRLKVRSRVSSLLPRVRQWSIKPVSGSSILIAGLACLALVLSTPGLLEINSNSLGKPNSELVEVTTSDEVASPPQRQTNWPDVQEYFERYLTPANGSIPSLSEYLQELPETGSTPPTSSPPLTVPSATTTIPALSETINLTTLNSVLNPPPFMTIHLEQLRSAGKILLIASGALLLMAGMLSLMRFHSSRRKERWRTRAREAVDDAINVILFGTNLRTSALSALEQDVQSETRRILEATDSRHLWSILTVGEVDELIRQRLQHLIGNDESMRRGAEAAIIDLLPALPRSSKRLINRLRFILVVAHARELLAPDSLSPADLGKWAVLQERWPEITSAIVDRPSLMGDLETAAQDDKSTALCDLTRLGHIDRSDDLIALLRTEPKLSAHIDLLVNLDRTEAGN
jgi:KAP family P-loop domain